SPDTLFSPIFAVSSKGSDPISDRANSRRFLNMIRRWLVHFAAAAVAAALFLSPPAAVAADAAADQPLVSFDKQIRPILSDRCYFCHGPDEDFREAGLRLDVREAAIEDLGGGAAIVPGDPDASLVIQRVTESDEDMLMPPSSSQKPRLSDEEVALLRLWIEQGAVFEPHW